MGVDGKLSPKFTVVAGPARAGKTSRLLADYRRRLATGPIGSALWLCPTHRSALAAGESIIDAALPGCLGPNLLSFDQFASRLLAAAAPKMRPLSPLLVRSILQELIRTESAAGRLDYFASIAGSEGLLNLVVEFVGELKRLEIWPEELAAAHGPGAGAKDRQLARLYADYQNRLLRDDLYDVQGRFWAARELLRDGHWGPFARVEHVYVDGFTDFTRTEHEVLEILARRVQTFTVSLPLEGDGRRGDLFFKTEATLAELGRRHAQLTVERLPPRPGASVALDHLQRRLFAPAGEPVESCDAAGIEIVPAAGVTHEIELVARRIKGLLRGAGRGGPLAPGDILVVFRSLGETASLVREIFARYGIACAVGQDPPLSSAPILQALVAWLRLDVEDWPFARVLGMLAHNHFRPPWPEWQHGRAAVALETVVRELEIPAGRADLVRAVERLAAAADRAAGEKRRLGAGLRQALVAAPLLGRMTEALDRLPRQATPGEWAAALDDFARSVGLLAAAQENPVGPEAVARDLRAWQRLVAALGEVERLARWRQAAPPRWQRREFLDELERLLRVEPLPGEHDESGRVRVLSAEAARNLSAPYVFLAGLAERSFPPAPRDNCLYGDADRRRLANQGLPFSSHEVDSRYEMLLFYEVATRATRQLVLSYPALDAAAQPLTPSPYVSEVQRAFGGESLPTGPPPHLTTVPADDDVRSPSEFRLRAVLQALAGEPGLLAEWCGQPATRATSENVLAALAASAARQQGESFGRFEGILTSPAAADSLAKRYGPERCWSPSQLEQYASCPFRFFMASVLHAEPVAEPALTVDYLERGRILHWLLSSAHRRLNELSGRPTSPGEHEPARFLDIVRELAAEWRRGGGQRALAAGLLEIDVRKVLTWIDAYHQQHAEYDRHWNDWSGPPRPAHFEVSFGPPRGEAITASDDPPEAADPLSRTDPFELDCEGETVRFAGRIDRIDLGDFAGQTVFSVVDYKSGAASKRTSQRAVYEGSALQLPLYTLAAGWLLAEQGALPLRAAYWHVANKGYRDADAVKLRAVSDERLVEEPEWEELQRKLRSRVREVVGGVRRGEFPMHSADEHCTGRCPYRTVCRVNQIRALGKTWPPPGDEQP